MDLNKAVDDSPHQVLGIYFYVNFVPGEYFNGLLDFREPAIKMSLTRLNAQHVGFEREGQQFGHKGAMGWGGIKKIKKTQNQNSRYSQHTIVL